MRLTQLCFQSEPVGELYWRLLDYAATNCKTALLVVRKSLPFNPIGEQVLNYLSPFLKSKEESMEWPGTVLLDETAWVFQYHLTSECAKILKQATHALYDWKQPLLPEDLCLLREDGSSWLVSISHERDGYLNLSLEEQRNLLLELPEIRFPLALQVSW